MEWRVIIRWSFDKDVSSTMRNNLEALLNQCNISRTTTGTWECRAANPKLAADKIGEMLKRIADSSLVNGVDPAFALDHIWVYIDRE
jgi:hypothetical protein